MENDIKKRIPPWSENVEKYRISSEYTLVSYTTPLSGIPILLQQ